MSGRCAGPPINHQSIEQIVAISGHRVSHRKSAKLKAQIGFSISHMGFTNFFGFFSGASGALQLDPAKPSAAKLQVSVSVQTVLRAHLKTLCGDWAFESMYGFVLYR